MRENKGGKDMTHYIFIALLSIIDYNCVLMPEGVILTYDNGFADIVYGVTCEEIRSWTG